MSFEEKDLKSLFNRIGGAMLIFILAFNLLCGGSAILGEGLTQLTYSKTVYVLTELLNAVAYIAAFTIPVWFFGAISKNKRVEPFGLSLVLAKKDTALISTAMMFLGTSICFVASYVNSLLFPVSKEAAEIYFSTEEQEGYALVLMFISTAIIPAFVEELLFRGVILSSIRPYSEGGAILISSLLFGLMHQTPFQLFYATAIGVILGIIRVRTGSIWTGVLVHFFNNFLSVIQTYLLDRYDEQTGNLIYMILTLSIILLGLVLGSVLYIKSQKNNVGAQIGVYQKADFPGTKIFFQREDIKVYKAFFTPTVIIFIVLCAITMVSTAIMIGGV